MVKRHSAGRPDSSPLVNALERALRRAVANNQELALRVLPEGQFFVRRGMVPNPLSGQGVKAAVEIPGRDGFEIVVRCSLETESTPGMPASAAIHPHTRASALRTETVGGTSYWSLRVPEGTEVTVRVSSGEQASAAEISDVLSVIEKVVSAGGRVAGGGARA
jgi:hypothetical protein